MRYQTLRERAERGQALVLLAAAFIGLAAFVGLTIDAGILFSSVGHLRRAADAASLAAANQFREGRPPPQLEAEAVEMIKLNGLDEGTARAKLCDLSGLYPGNHESSLCPDPGEPNSKIVRVYAEMTVHFAFLPIIGFDETTITATAESEAASIDVALVLDVSESMALDLCDDNVDNDGDGKKDAADCKPAAGTEPYEDDVQACLDATASSHYPYSEPVDIEVDFPNECHPFESVRHAAHRLIDRMYFPYDRISIVTFGQLAHLWLALEDGDTPGGVPAVCLPYVDPDKEKNCAHAVLDEIMVELAPERNPSDPYLCEDATARGCMTTNIGDGLLTGGGVFCPDDDGDDVCDREEMREEAVWITILLTDGAANAGTRLKDPLISHDDWICPATTYLPPAPMCRDQDPSDRHADVLPVGPAQPYDADDYARDVADFVGCPGPGITPYPADCPAGGGVGSVIFAIGLGDNVIDNPDDDTVPRAGEFLLRYVASVGDDGDPSTDPYCRPDPGEGVSCGNYYFAPQGDALIGVFEDIASRIFTRITH
jgi:hypothetical protein